jgi:hypothetical protein
MDLVFVLCRVHRGVRGGASRPPLSQASQGVGIPLVHGFERSASQKKDDVFYIFFWQIFRHIVFVDGFLVLVKELCFFTNPVQSIRGLDVMGSYMYIVL